MTTCARCRSTAAIAAITIAATLALLSGSALADKGDKRGWSLDTDPRKRVFLKYVPADDGPRLLVLGCLRDVDSFVAMSEQGMSSPQSVTLTLANGAARHSFDGKIEPDSVGQAGFVSELDLDPPTLRELRSKLIPVLEGKGPIVLTVGTDSRELPVSGLGKPLGGFKSVCFR
jgi:hypothetical protein